MKHANKDQRRPREGRWMLFNKGCIHGVHHSELVVVRSTPNRSLSKSSTVVLTVSRALVIATLVGFLALVIVLLAACEAPRAQRGGSAATSFGRPGFTNSATFAQSENPKEPSRQTVESEQSVEYVLPPGTQIFRSNGGLIAPLPSQNTDFAPNLAGRSEFHAAGSFAQIDRPMPVRMLSKDRTETSIGGAQKDTVREFAAKAAAMRPVMWVGIIMTTLVAGALIYFGWWTKAAVAVGVGISMIVLAQSLPQHGTVILLAGLGSFAVVALLVLYAYHKGQLDQNHNGIPDVMEKSLPY